MKFKPNLEHARSLVRFNCTSSDCTGGDFEISDVLAGAVAGRKTSVSGELRCLGTRHNKETKESQPCQMMLRFTIKLAYVASMKQA